MNITNPVQFSGRLTQAGDTILIRHPLGRHTLDLRATVEVDQFQSIDDDCGLLDDARRAAYLRGDWCYLEVVVSMEINGEEVDCQTLSGIDVGDDPRYLLCVANDLIGKLSLPLRTLGYEGSYAPLAQPAGGAQ